MYYNLKRWYAFFKDRFRAQRPEKGSHELAGMHKADIETVAQLVFRGYTPLNLDQQGEPEAAQAFRLLYNQLYELALLPFVYARVEELHGNNRDAPPVGYWTDPANANTNDIGIYQAEAPPPPTLTKPPPPLSKTTARFFNQRKKQPFWRKPQTDTEWYQHAHTTLTDISNSPVIDVALHPIRSGKHRGWDIITNNEGKNVTYRFVCQCTCHVDYSGNPSWSACRTQACIRPWDLFDPTPKEKKGGKAKKHNPNQKKLF